jgi:excisionase family DNA binding protein
VSIERSLDRAKTQSARLVSTDGQMMILPEPLYRVLAEAVHQLAAGNGVAILPYRQELTTQQAADLLNVSRPHVVGLLESGAIAFHKVGTHRRVYLKDLLKYKRRRDAGRRSLLQKMVDEAQEDGTYED